jgi:hypothetical protein
MLRYDRALLLLACGAAVGPKCLICHNFTTLLTMSIVQE